MPATPFLFLSYLVAGTAVPQVFHPVILGGVLCLLVVLNYRQIARFIPLIVTSTILLLLLVGGLPSPFPCLSCYLPFSLAVFSTAVLIFLLCVIGVKLGAILGRNKE